MTTGNLLYLAMTIGMFGVFALMLAYQSWRQSQLESVMIGTSTESLAPKRPTSTGYEDDREAQAA